MSQFAIISCVVFLFRYLTSGNAEVSPETIRIQVQNDQQTFILNLKRTDQYLANENLPIWLARKNEEPELVSDVMQELGPFTMYHDTKMSAAVILFHKLQHIFGVIDTRFYIKKLPLVDGELNIVAAVGGPYIKRRSTKFSHDSFFNYTIKDSRNSNSDTEVQIDNVLYPEILIFITNDVYEFLAKDRRGIRLLVKYYLIHFNAVDMLFAKLPSDLKIHLNIAGLVIETEKDVFPMFYYPEGLSKYINGFELLSYFNILYINKYNNIFTPDLFDFYYISVSEDIKFFNLIVSGLSATVENYESRKNHKSTYKTSGMIVKQAPNWIDFITSAHEIAHQMKVEHDSITEGRYCYGAQCFAILQQIGDFCRNCIRWSNKSINEFRKYASSNVDRCFLLNLPRSLEPYGSRIETLTSSQQCKCYGYQFSWFRYLLQEIRGLRCDQKLECTNNIWLVFHNIPKPIDGTPCNEHKVCWQEKCLPVYVTPLVKTLDE